MRMDEPTSSPRAGKQQSSGQSFLLRSCRLFCFYFIATWGPALPEMASAASAFATAGYALARAITKSAHNNAVAQQAIENSYRLQAGLEANPAPMKTAKPRAKKAKIDK